MIAKTRLDFNAVFFGLACDDSGKEQDRDDVRNRHQAVKDVSDVPDELKFRQRACENSRHPNYFVNQDGLLAEQIDGATLAVIVPAQHCRKCERDKAHNKHGLSDNRNFGKGKRRKLGAVDAGIKEESAYYESLHEVPLIANLIDRKRLYEMA